MPFDGMAVCHPIEGFRTSPALPICQFPAICRLRAARFCCHSEILPTFTFGKSLREKLRNNKST
jgi:hypothetical protein